MRIVVFILAILGGLAAAALGAVWLADAAAVEQLQLGEEAGVALEGIVTAGYLLLLALALAIAGGVLALLRKGKFAAGVLISAAVAPAIFEPKSLVFSFLLVVAGLLAFAVKPKLDAHTGLAPA